MATRWLVVLSLSTLVLILTGAQHHGSPHLMEPLRPDMTPGGGLGEKRLGIVNASRRQTGGNSFLTMNQVSTPVTINVNTQTSLYVQPNQVATLYFDIVNNNNYNVFYYFYCGTTTSAVQSIQPYESWITGQGTITVKVMIRVSSSSATTETVTFTGVTYTQSGDDPTSVKAYMFIGQQTSDSSSPGVDYTINGNCQDNNSPSTCATANWGFTANIQDSNSGLLSVATVPSGFVFTTDFVAGTKQRVSGRYSASCCLNKVDLIATDLNGNQYRTSVDVYNAWLSSGSIAAIVLASILLLVIIIVICCAIAFCIRRRRRSKFTVHS